MEFLEASMLHLVVDQANMLASQEFVEIFKLPLRGPVEIGTWYKRKFLPKA
jgi:hypothetical protein